MKRMIRLAIVMQIQNILSKTIIYTRASMTKYTQKSQLFPSGLLGPVSIQSVNK